MLKNLISLALALLMMVTPFAPQQPVNEVPTDNHPPVIMYSLPPDWGG